MVSISGMVGRISIGVGGGGSVGGISVGGGGCVGTTCVGTGVDTTLVGAAVGGAEVLVGASFVFVGLAPVEVGCTTGGVDVFPAVGKRLGTRVREVAVEMNVEVGEGVRVTEGVAVGIVEVMVGMSEAVTVGAVDVGNGPRRASEVKARAVFVLLALDGFK
jgi:hypothetical protein